MSTKAQQVLTVDDVRAIAAALPAEHEKQRQADQREMQRVYEFHSLTAEAAQYGGNSDSTVTEQLEQATRISGARLRQAKRTAFEAAYRETLEPDLRQEREAILPGQF